MDRTSKAIRLIQDYVARIVKSLDTTDHYTLLDVPLDATPQQMRQSYRAIVGAYRVVMQHESCPKALGNDVWVICQRLGVALQELCDGGSREAHNAAFKPVPRSPDAPPFHPVRLRPDQATVPAEQESAILFNFDLETDDTVEVDGDPTVPYRTPGDDTEIDSSFPLFEHEHDDRDTFPDSEIDDDDEVSALQEVATAVDPRMPWAAMEEPIEEDLITAVDRPLRAADVEPLSPVATEVEEPTDMDRAVPSVVTKVPKD